MQAAACEAGATAHPPHESALCLTGCNHDDVPCLANCSMEPPHAVENCFASCEQNNTACAADCLAQLGIAPSDGATYTVRDVVRHAEAAPTVNAKSGRWLYMHAEAGGGSQLVRLSSEVDHGAEQRVDGKSGSLHTESGERLRVVEPGR